MSVKENCQKTDNCVKCSSELDKLWDELASMASPETVEALKEAHAFYDGKSLAKWIGGLYDPDIGGFYYSNSARDNEPYRPDLESTAFAFSFLTSNGAIKDRNTELSERVCEKIVDFARELQSPVDGYFYHPQWPKGRENLNGDRYGRDIATARHFITSFYVDRDGDGVKERQYPKWCIPGTETKCAIHQGTDERCSFPIVIPKSGKTATEVGENPSAEKKTAKVKPLLPNQPDYSSPDGFMAWLDRYNGDVIARDDSGNAHSIAELRYEIIQHGYAEILLDYLDDIQARIYDEQTAAGEKPTGMFQKSVNYRAAWGFFKYMAIYNLPECHRRIDIKYVPHIVDSYIEIIKMKPDGGYFVNDLMNQWLGIERLVANVRKYYGEGEVEKIRARMRESAPVMIRNSLEKVRPFKIEDGSFGYNPDGRSIAVIYGTPISWGCREGDLNSVILATNMYRAMFTGFGYTPVPLCTSEDGRMVAEMLENAVPIRKSREWIAMRTFDSERDLRFIKAVGRADGISYTITDDPKNAGNPVLELDSSPDYEGAVSFNVLPLGYARNIFETKMLLDSSCCDGTVLICSMRWRFKFSVIREGDRVKIGCAKNDGISAVELDAAKIGEWFTLRVEYIHSVVADDSVRLMPDDEAVITVDGQEIFRYTPDAASRLYVDACFTSPRESRSIVLLDDCYFASEN